MASSVQQMVVLKALLLIVPTSKINETNLDQEMLM